MPSQALPSADVLGRKDRERDPGPCADDHQWREAPESGPQWDTCQKSALQERGEEGDDVVDGGSLDPDSSQARAEDPAQRTLLQTPPRPRIWRGKRRHPRDFFRGPQASTTRYTSEG